MSVHDDVLHDEDLAMQAFEDATGAISERGSVRMHFRTKPHIKQAIQQAAAWCGVDDSAFVMNAAYKAALETIQTHERTIVSQRDYDAILKAIDDASPPTDALREAFARHDRLIEQP